MFQIEKLSKKTGIPVVTIIRRKPDVARIKEVLNKLNQKGKLVLLDKAGSVVKIGHIYAQPVGINIEKLKEILKLVCTRSNIPEPLRLAHLIASGVVKGESVGRA